MQIGIGVEFIAHNSLCKLLSMSVCVCAVRQEIVRYQAKPQFRAISRLYTVYIIKSVIAKVFEY